MPDHLHKARISEKQYPISTLKSTFSFAVVVLPSRHKPDTGVADEEDFASCYVGRSCDHLSSILGGNLTDKQIDAFSALVQCYPYWSGNATAAFPAETGAWITAGSNLALLLAHQLEHLQHSKFTWASWVAQITCFFYCNSKTTTCRLTPAKRAACYPEKREVQSAVTRALCPSITSTFPFSEMESSIHPSLLQVKDYQKCDHWSPRPPIYIFMHKSWDGVWVDLLVLSWDKDRHFSQQLHNEKEIMSVNC